MANRQNFDRNTRVAIIQRASAKRPDGQPSCEQCGAIGVKLEIHHRKMDAMVLAEDKRRKLTAGDGELLCESCHDPITSAQRKILAKAQAVEAKHLGASPPAGTIKSRGFPPPEKPKREKRDPVQGLTAMQRRIKDG